MGVAMSIAGHMPIPRKISKEVFEVCIPRDGSPGHWTYLFRKVAARAILRVFRLSTTGTVRPMGGGGWGRGSIPEGRGAALPIQRRGSAAGDSVMASISGGGRPDD